MKEPQSSSTTGSVRAPASRSKFTRGEKCIYIHLVVTFCLIVFLCLIYFIHLCVVDHTYNDILKISRRNQPLELSNFPVGYVCLAERPTRLLCNAVLLHARWSVGPAHCAAARTHPETASLLHAWRIRYAILDKEILESKIKRTIPHPQFDREDFRNNIGLFEHDSPIDGVETFDFSGYKAIDDDLMMQNDNKITLYGWSSSSSTNLEDTWMVFVRYDVRPVATVDCVRFMSPILDMREYEHCVLLQSREDGVTPDHGSVIVVDTTIVGFFAWGEKSGKGAPCIIVDFQPFRTWMENIINR